MSSAVSAYDSYATKMYHSPFFDLSNFYMPQNFKQFFSWARYFFLTNNIISPTVYQMARYPITSLTYNTTDNDSRELYKSIFEDYLSIQSNLISIGLDFFTYGNAFAALHVPFKRVFICKMCKQKFDADDTDYKFQLSGVKFKGKCKHCKRNTDFIAKDEGIRVSKKFRIVRYYPGDIDIHYNSLTGDTQYLYSIPKKDVSAIRRGSKFHINTTPLLHLKAIDKKRQIIFRKDKLFHFKRDNVSGSDMQWGMPLVLPALKKAFYLQILQKAQEAIAIQHIIPLTMLFPQGSGNMNPHEMLNLANWKNKLEGVVNLWKKDPNHIAIFPFPVGSQHIFGEGRKLLVTPEVREAAIQVVSAMGVPQEFVFGGLSWSASSVNLRMLENAFMTYRTLIKKFLIYIRDQISTCMRIPKIELDLKEFKMIDDVQQKQLLVDLNAASKISDETLLNALGRDQKEELDMLEAEWRKKFEKEKGKMIAQEKFNGEMAILRNKMAMKAQAEAEQMAQESQVQQMPPGLDPTGGDLAILQQYPPELQAQIMKQMNMQAPNTASAIMQGMQEQQLQQQQQAAAPATQGAKQGSRPKVSGGGNPGQPQEKRPQ